MATFVWVFIFGCIGMGYISYGKSQRAIKPMLCGTVLIGFPYFVSGAWLDRADWRGVDADSLVLARIRAAG